MLNYKKRRVFKFRVHLLKMSNLEELLLVTDDDIAKARRHYQKSESDIQQDVAILKEWLRQQPHLPDDEDDGRLERMFLKNKCRLEQTKRKLDKCYSFKLFHPELLDMYDIHSITIQNARNSMILVPLPKMTDKQERIMLLKVTDSKTFQGLNCFIYALMVQEFSNTYDYSLADIYIIDWNGLSFNAMKTMDPKLVKNFFTLALEALSGRYSSIHYINVPSFVSVFLQMLKIFMKPKLFNKIKCNLTVEGMYDSVPKALLPMEYGGEQKSIYKLHDDWGKELELHADLFLKMSRRISDEKLRIEKLDESDLFGVDGSFKKINLD